LVLVLVTQVLLLRLPLAQGWVLLLYLRSHSPTPC
jgi:hypothetical protein